MAVYIAKKCFAITTSSGSVMFAEGQAVPENIAKAYPHNIVGLAKEEKRVQHNPNLKEKLSEKEIAKMSEDTLRQWIAQFHPANMPAGEVKKEELVEVVKNLNS